MKKENRKINKDDLNEVTGNRDELAKYVGQTFDVPVFITNTYGYQNEKRLVTEIHIKEYFINHAWFKAENIGNLDHGYQKLKVEVTKYKDHTTNTDKFGLRYVGKKGKRNLNNALIRPKWMKDED